MTQSLGHSFASTNVITSRSSSKFSTVSQTSFPVESRIFVESDTRTVSVRRSEPGKRLQNLERVAKSHKYIKSKTMDEAFVTKIQVMNINSVKKSSL